MKSSTGQKVSYRIKGYGNNQFGKITAFFWTYPKRKPIRNRLMSIMFDGRTCEAVHVNALLRHGTRYVDKSLIRAFNALQRKLRHSFINPTFAFINDWVNHHPQKKAGLLSVLGEKEMAYLGEFHGEELYDLLNGSVSTEGNLVSARFAASKMIRTQESAKWFYRGLTRVLNGRESRNLEPEIRQNILRFYDNCKGYIQEPLDLREQRRLERGVLFQNVITGVTERLATNVTLLPNKVLLVYKLCASELAIMNNADWCKLMTDTDMEVLEYYTDIEDYMRSYGHPVAGEMSCPLVRDIFIAMDNVISANDQGSNYTKGMFQIGHSGTVTDVAVALGLFKDSDSLRADNYRVMKNRAFRASKQDPFAAHFTFILYHCKGSGTDNYAVKLFYNSVPMPIPKCNSDTCWYNEVRQSYRQLVDDCKWSSIC